MKVSLQLFHPNFGRCTIWMAGSSLGPKALLSISHFQPVREFDLMAEELPTMIG